MCNILTHKLYVLSKIRRYITSEACILIFKTMILPLMEYGDIIFTGTSTNNLLKVDRLFYRGLRICMNYNIKVGKEKLCTDCKLKPRIDRGRVHLLFMHKQTSKFDLLKKPNRCTRLHNAPVFDTYKPNNEEVKSNVLYRGAISWNKLPASERNMEFKEFKKICVK